MNFHRFQRQLDRSPGTKLSIKHQLNHICDTVEPVRYRFDDEPDGQALRLTVSIGVCCHQKGDTITTVI